MKYSEFFVDENFYVLFGVAISIHSASRIVKRTSCDLFGKLIMPAVGDESKSTFRYSCIESDHPPRKKLKSGRIFCQSESKK